METVQPGKDNPRWFREIRDGLSCDGCGEVVDGAELARAIRANESQRAEGQEKFEVPPNIEISNFHVKGKVDLCDVGKGGNRPLNFKISSCVFDGPIMLDHAWVQRLMVHGGEFVAIIARGSHSQRVVLDEINLTCDHGVMVQFQSASIAGSMIIRGGCLGYANSLQGLLDDPEWGKRITGAALDVADSKIEGQLIVDRVAIDRTDKCPKCEGAILLQHATFGGGVSIDSVAVTSAIGARRGNIDAAGCKTGADFSLTSSQIAGNLNLEFASIGNNLKLTRNKIEAVYGDEPCIYGRGLEVAGDFLVDQCQLKGMITLVGAHLRDSLRFLDSVLAMTSIDDASRVDQTANFALDATDIRAGGSVVFGWANAGGEDESERGAYAARKEWKIAVGIEKGDGKTGSPGTIRNIRENPPTAQAVPPFVKGAISFERARIGGDFVVDGLWLEPARTANGAQAVSEQRPTLSLKGANIDGYLRFNELLTLNNIRVDLSHASARVFSDSLKLGWNPRQHVMDNGKAPCVDVDLDGFTYDEIEEIDDDRDLKPRIEWLRGHKNRGFQRYFQLARVYAAIGDQAKSRDVLVEGLREEHDLKAAKWAWIFGHLFRIFFGYGYRPKRAILSFLAVYAIGFLGVYEGLKFDKFVVDTTSTVALSTDAPIVTARPAEVLSASGAAIASTYRQAIDPSDSVRGIGATLQTPPTHQDNQLKQQGTQSEGSDAAAERKPPHVTIRTSIENASPQEVVCKEIDPKVYALDVMVPLLDLRQKAHCIITSDASAWMWRLGMALYAALGAVVTSLALLTVSGVLRRDLSR